MWQERSLPRASQPAHLARFGNYLSMSGRASRQKCPVTMMSGSRSALMTARAASDVPHVCSSSSLSSSIFLPGFVVERSSHFLGFLALTQQFCLRLSRSFASSSSSIFIKLCLWCDIKIVVSPFKVCGQQPPALSGSCNSSAHPRSSSVVAHKL